MTSQQITPANQRAEMTVQSLVRDNWQAIGDSLPETMDPKRFARLVFNSVRKNPRLAEATASSLIGSLLTAATLGLDVDTPLGEANLVPYRRKDRRSGKEWTEAQLIIGYQGIVRLYRQHPSAGSVQSGWVGEHDLLDYAYGTHPYLNHVPARGDRGKPVAFWASYTLKDGTTDFCVLSPAEVAELRGKGENERRDVDDPQHWMERKTALKQALKLAPKSTQLVIALTVDERTVQQVGAVHGVETLTAFVGPTPQLDRATGEITHFATEEPTYAEPEPEPETEPLRTEAQMRKLWALAKKMGMDSPGAFKAWLEDMLGRPVESTKTLTKDEAARMIEQLEADAQWMSGEPQAPEAVTE